MTRLVLVLLLVMSCVGSVRAQVFDETTLHSAGLKSDQLSLLEFLRQRSREVIPQEESHKLIAELSNETTHVEAAAKLIMRGPAVVACLRSAKNNQEASALADRATKCLTWIEGKPGTEITLSVVRLAGINQSPDIADALLKFAPYAEDTSVLEAIGASLAKVAYASGKPNPALINALRDPRAFMRILAVESLAKNDQFEVRRSLLPLLNDPVRIVKQRSAIALCKADELQSVPVLVGLLSDAGKSDFVSLEQTLQSLAGDTAPKGLPSGETPAVRKATADAWAEWWKKIDGPELIAEFRKRTLFPEELAEIRDLVRKLGDANYRTREKATDTLSKKGAKALPFLREAMIDSDNERAKRAEDCVAKINADDKKRLPSGTPRLIMLRRPAGAVDAMLAYSPFVDDDEAILIEIRDALTAMSRGENQSIDPDLLKALGDPHPARRSIAAEVLCRGIGKPIESEVKKLLKDTVPSVRQSAAVALVLIGSKEAVSVLIDLIGELPPSSAWPSLDTLQLLAGDTNIPTPATDAIEERRQFRDRWAAWWKSNSDKIDIAKAVQGTGYLGHTVLVEVLNNNNGRVIEIGRDGKIRWKIDNLRYPVDAFVLPGDRVLITEWDGNKVTEFDTRGKVIWRKEGLAGRATNANRLPNGNTFISTTNELLEVDKSGKEVYKIPVVAGVTAAYRAANGEIVCLRNDSKVVRYAVNGSEIKTFDSKRDSAWTSGLDLVRNGNILVAQPNPNQKVTEFTPDGKVVWEWNAPAVTTATRLPNGNILAASHSQSNVSEYDRAGKKIWEYKDEYHIFRARRR